MRPADKDGVEDGDQMGAGDDLGGELPGEVDQGLAGQEHRDCRYDPRRG